MSTDRAMGIAVMALAATLAWQAAHAPPDTISGHVMMASWAHLPENVGEAVELSDEIVVGKVVRVRQAEPLSVEAPGEPDGRHTVPVQAVTFQIEKRLKEPADRRERPERVEVFRTGGSDAEGETMMLEGDPEYRPGQRYLLFLADGPELRVEGSRVLTKSVISPEGRYGVGQDGRLEPASPRGNSFAARQRGQPLEQFEGTIAANVDNPGRGRP